jgi:hypothetical protein
LELSHDDVELPLLLILFGTKYRAGHEEAEAALHGRPQTAGVGHMRQIRQSLGC